MSAIPSPATCTRPPKVSVVGTSYNKQGQIKFFLHSIFRQTYGGDIELIIVDDFSRDMTLEVVREYVPVLRNMFPERPVEIVVLKNEANLGNCVSRNRGIQRASGEIIVITDSDCMLSANFIASYVAVYGGGGCDAVVSDFGIELLGRNPLGTLEFYEGNPGRVKADRKVQDPGFPSSFLNTVTRGFSIRASYVTGPLYDEEFGYTDSPNSGFGWEDIEAGCRLHEGGARIAYADGAFTIHLSHRSTANPRTKCLGSLRNYRRLHARHPWLAELRGDWSRETYAKILANQAGASQLKNGDNLFLEAHLGTRPRTFVRRCRSFLDGLIGRVLRLWPGERNRRSPDFLIVGVIKGATTSLYSYLGRHPDICRALSKEVRYFTAHFGRGDEWYLDQFPSLVNHYQGIVTGEATPTYLEHPDVPRRVHRSMPNARIIVLLRNPVDRAYSNYQMLVRAKVKAPSFEEVIEAEMRDRDPQTNYLARGRYHEHLLNWLAFFPRHQIMIIRSEDLGEDPGKCLSRVHDFLRVPRQALPSYGRTNSYADSYPPMNPETRSRLVEYYKPHNGALEKLLNRRFFWDY